MPSKDTVTMTIRIPEAMVAEIDDARRWAKLKRSAMAVELIRLGLLREPEVRNSGGKDVLVDSVVLGDNTEETDHE